MASFEIEIEVICDEYGSTLKTFESQSGFGNSLMSVEPCENCLEKEYDRGVEDGVANLK